MADWIAQFDEEIRGLRHLVDEGMLATERIAALEKENRALQSQLSALQVRVPDLERAAKLSARQRRSSQRRELGDAISALLPGIHLLRDSLDVITQELESFEPILRELRNLHSAPADVKGERVEGAPQWKERRFSTGQKHDGRLYFRNDDRAWRALVSFKDSQEQDIEYLKSC